MTAVQPTSIDQLLAEAEFQNHEALTAFANPPFTVREVTDEPEYTGGWLAHNGPPPLTKT